MAKRISRRSPRAPTARGRPAVSVHDVSYRHSWMAPVVPLSWHPQANVLFFERGAMQPRRADHVALHAHAQRLREDRALHVTIVGHANPGESPEAARELAWQRAQSIRRLLVRFGARPMQVESETRAALEPAADVASPRGRVLNRRVHLRWWSGEHAPAWQLPVPLAAREESGHVVAA